MTVALIIAAFLAGAGFMAYQRDREAKRRHWEEWDRQREAEKARKDH